MCHSQIHKRSNKKPDNACLEKFVEDADFFLAGENGSQDNECK